MFAFLLIVQTMIAVALISVILMQRSEGGGLGVGGSSSGFMTARGAADFLTRSTAILGGMFMTYVVELYRHYSDQLSRATFRFSILYLAALFFALLVDHYW